MLARAEDCQLAMEMNPRKRGRYIWPEEAKRLVARSLRTQDKGSHAVLLHDRLLQLTGFSDPACWRFWHVTACSGRVRGKSSSS